jgi:hypothetical protein
LTDDPARTGARVSPRAAVVPDLSPEARRSEAMRWRAGFGTSLAQAQARLGPGSNFHQIITRVWTGVINDGFIHAGNFAYMTPRHFRCSANRASARRWSTRSCSNCRRSSRIRSSRWHAR